MEFILFNRNNNFESHNATNFHFERGDDDAKVEEADHEDFEKIERIIRESTMFC